MDQRTIRGHRKNKNRRKLISKYVCGLKTIKSNIK